MKREKLWLFVNQVFGTFGHETCEDEDGESSSIVCQNCGRETKEGDDDSLSTDDKGRQILECCFEEVFGPFKKRVDHYEIGLLEYLLSRFEEDPLDSRFSHARLCIKSAVKSWHKAAQKQAARASDVKKMVEGTEETEEV